MNYSISGMQCSPWFNNRFRRAMEKSGAHIVYATNEKISLAGIERRTRFGLRLLQVGSHFGEGLVVNSREVDLLSALRSLARHGTDGVSIISHTRLDELNSYQTTNSTGTIVLDLSSNENDLWRKIRKSFKGCINQGKKRGNTINWNEDHDMANIETLYINHLLTKKYCGIDWKVIRSLRTVNEEDLRLDLGLVRNAYGDPAAMAAILICGEIAIYFVGASNPDYFSCYPGHFLHWNAILRCKEMGCGWYDFGGATQDRNKVTFEITKFKRGFGGEYIDFQTYDIPLSKRYALYKKIKQLAKKCYPPGSRQ